PAAVASSDDPFQAPGRRQCPDPFRVGEPLGPGQAARHHATATRSPTRWGTAADEDEERAALDTPRVWPRADPPAGSRCARRDGPPPCGVEPWPARDKERTAMTQAPQQEVEVQGDVD